MNQFKDKVVIVTGGTSGIGYATAKQFADEGAKVVITGLKEEKGTSAASTFGTNVSFISSDVRDEAEVQKLLGTIAEKYGHVDIVINNAGVSIHGEFDVTKYSVEDYEKLMDTNVKGVFLMTKHAIPHLLKSGGNMVNIGSRLGLKPLAGDAFMYASSKAAVIMFTTAMALTYRDKGVRVNCVCPGGTDTALLRNLYDSDDEYAEDAKGNFRGRNAKPEEIADAVTFLASEKAHYITGAVLPVDGGSSI